MNFLFIGPPIHEGMAGSKRIKNLWNQLKKHNNILYCYSYRESRFHNFDYSGNYITKYYQLFQTIFLLAKKKGVVYHYGYPSIKILPVLFLSKLIGFKVIVDIVEDISFKTEFTTFLNRINSKIRKLILNHLPWISDGLIVISVFLLSKFQEQFNNRLKIILIPISIDVKYFQRIPKRFPNRKKKITLFYGGSFASKDGFDDIIKAVNYLCYKYGDMIELVLSGRIDRKQNNIILKIINSFPYKNQLRYLGFLTDEEYYKVLNSCDIHLMNRNKSNFAGSGFPFKLGEMLASGKPVVASKIGEIDTILVDKEDCILVEPENTQSLINAIEFLIENPKKALEIGLNGRGKAIGLFNSEDIYLKFISFIYEIHKG
jgi:glycosyltransferase involved in cell wall biosynthesis